MFQSAPSTNRQRRTLRGGRALPFIGCLCLLLFTFRPLGAASDDLEFFEKRVRPVFVEHCARCHSAQAEKVKGGLLLDSQAGVAKGGESGPVLLPRHPEQSRLVTALSYADPNLQMPPKGKLSDGQIADISEWIRRGAPWPDSDTQAHAAGSTGAFNLEQRRQRHWSWQPIRVPAIPSVKDEVWVRTSVDRFVLMGLERTGLAHAPRADGRALLRRLHFDLTGLPPTREDLERYERNPSREAYEAEVDRLLATPQFGERWARHWLDLVRYAETLGHEFDYPNPNAWRYRDYVIRALNADVPYDQFVIEHVAGDLLASPRRNPEDGQNESVTGTAFYWLGQRDHAPVDVRQHQAELIDNQIDVLSKTFLGLTVACARCHDHKFDAIPTRDYYSLYGILSSSRYAQSSVEPPEGGEAVYRQLQHRKARLRQAIANAWSPRAVDAARYLLAAREAVGDGEAEEAIDRFASEHDLDTRQLARWIHALHGTESRQSQRFMQPWIEWARAAALAEPDREKAWQAAVGSGPTAANACPSNEILFANFEHWIMPAGWFARELAFAESPAPAGDYVVGDTNRPIARLLGCSAVDSGIISARFQGTLSSPSFTITNRYIHILAAGRGSRINVPIDGFTMIRDPIYGGLKRMLDHDQYRWVTIDVGMWQGRRAYLEFNDTSAPDPGDDPRPNGFDTKGYVSVRRIVFSDSAAVSNEPVPGDVGEVLGSEAPRTMEDVAVRYASAMVRAVESWRAGSLGSAQAAWLQWLVGSELLDASEDPDVRAQVREYNQLEATIPDPIRVPSLVEGTGCDERVFVRGNHRLPGDLAPRRFLCAIAGEDQPTVTRGSGRLELARHLIDPGNPFLARVMVNRVWSHLFGQGLVPTPDDFGELGRAPSHPELLDWLANWFRTEAAWSTKRLIRLLVTSSAYAMSSKPADPRAEELDPANALWHRMPVRRLEGEVIRDSILAVSGRLDFKMFGQPVPTHLTEFMEGRGRPGQSGPLDGNGRRTIYQEVRRNFVSPMLRTFDMPVPFTTVGRRTVSSVPAQALILLNDPFVTAEARRWAEYLLGQTALAPQDRVYLMYETAFSRAPTGPEQAAAAAFLREQTERYEALGVEDPATRAWTDLCHVLFNLKEFVFLN
jgi:hypothetical protein